MANISKKDIEEFRKSGRMDEGWYLREYPDVKELRMDPVEHYLVFGAKLGRKPSPKTVTQPIAEATSGSAIRALGATATASAEADGRANAPVPPVSFSPASAAIAADFALKDNSYLAMRQDIENSGFWDERWYLAHYYFEYREFKKQFSGYEFLAPLDHYLQQGWKRGFEPSDRLPLQVPLSELRENKVAYFLNKLRFDGYHFDKNLWIPKLERVAEYIARKTVRKSKRVVYTCIVNGYDELMQPYYISDDWDYVCFTNNPDLLSNKTNGVWQINPLAYTNSDSAYINRWHKMQPNVLFPEYDESIYVDGNMNVISNYIFNEIERRDLDILLPMHFVRSCVYKEIEALLHSRRFGEAQKRQFQVCRAFLEREQFPADQGLTENNVIYRRHHAPAVAKLMNEWWDLFTKYPPRDQTTLAYAFWKNRRNIMDFTFANCRVNYRDFWIVKHNPAPAQSTAVPAPAPHDKIAAKALRPAFADNNIGVVFSTNEYFVPYLGVAIHSLIRNGSAGCNYDIIVLGNGLSAAAQAKLGALAGIAPNVSIRFYDMGDIYAALPKDIFHVEGYVPVETYNKCFITQILSGYDRCLYLDSDIVILDDVQKLHDIALDGCAIGATVNVANVNAAYAKKEIKGRRFDEYIRDELGVLDPNEYFQGGVLVFDMNALNRMNLLARSTQALKEVRQPVFFDQCIFNKMFYKNVKLVSNAWNHVWYMQNYSYLRGSVPDEVFFDYAHARIDPKIVHFASKDKPHTKFGWELGDVFWKYAYGSPFIEEILDELKEKDNEVSRAMRAAGGSDWYRVAPRVLIHIHLFYVDQLETMLAALANVTGCEYSLFVTMVEKNEEVERRIRQASKDATVLVVPNVGYDIYPFLHVLQQVRVAQFGYVLKIHTKNQRAPEQDTVYGIKVPGYAWRDELIGALAGSKEIFRRNLDMLVADKNLGALGARRFIFSTADNREEQTYKLADWRTRCGVTGGQHYVGGSMFMARAYPFERLKGLRMRPEDFKSAHMATKDYKNTAHAFERLLGIVIENEGFEIRGV